MAVSLFALSLLAVTGIGYAAFTATATATVNATAGNLSLQWTANSVDVGSDGYATCAPSGGGSAITETVSTIYPNSNGCIFNVTIQNNGNVPANTITVSPPAGTVFGAYNCFAVTYGGFPGTLAPGASSSGAYIQVYMPASDGPGCATQTGTITLTVSGST